MPSFSLFPGQYMVSLLVGFIVPRPFNSVPGFYARWLRINLRWSQFPSIPLQGLSLLFCCVPCLHSYNNHCRSCFQVHCSTNAMFRFAPLTTLLHRTVVIVRSFDITSVYTVHVVSFVYFLEYSKLFRVLNHTVPRTMITVPVCKHSVLRTVGLLSQYVNIVFLEQ